MNSTGPKTLVLVFGTLSTINVTMAMCRGELRIGGQTKPVSNCPYKSLEEREFEYEPYRVYDEEKKIYYCKGIKMNKIFLS